jgi:hypothetical protein
MSISGVGSFPLPEGAGVLAGVKAKPFGVAFGQP